MFEVLVACRWGGYNDSTATFRGSNFLVGLDVDGEGLAEILILQFRSQPIT
jgi:hypothetical protein